MGRIYFKELPLFHLYDGDLTGSQKLLMTLLLVDRYDIYELSCLARMCPEDVTADLAELKRKGYRKTSENRKEICAAAKRFRETVLLGIEYRLHGCAWVCMVFCEVTRFREVDTPHLRRGHRPPLFQRISGKQNITSHSEAGFRKRKPASLLSSQKLGRIL